MNSPLILIVDDDTWQCESYRRTLEQAGYTIALAHTPKAAIERIDEERPEAVILDMLLEGNTAFVLLHELQSDVTLSTIPIIVCTNLADQLHATAMQDYGIRRVLDKATMHPQDIIVALRMVGV